MPDDTADLDVTLIRNDGSEEFNLKINSIDRSMGNNVISKGILDAFEEMAGKDVALGFEKYSLDGKIQNTQEGTYPTGGDYPSVDHSSWERSTEKEMALAHAAKVWGPDASDGFDVLHWGPRGIDGMISKFTAEENRDQDGPEQYTFTLEWTHANRYMGDA